MGDGLLAIFPLTNPDSCSNLLTASKQAAISVVELNTFNAERGHAELRYGIGVHVGDVMYGNIGSRKRLDFTVIGSRPSTSQRVL